MINLRKSYQIRKISSHNENFGYSISNFEDCEIDFAMSTKDIKISNGLIL